MNATEKFWIGPDNPERCLVYKAQLSFIERAWIAAFDGTTLNTDYSDLSVRLYDPHAKTLSYVNQTIAILPKSRLRIIHKLIGAYLNEANEEVS